MPAPEPFWNMGPDISANRPNLVSLGSKHPNPGIRSLFNNINRSTSIDAVWNSKERKGALW